MTRPFYVCRRGGRVHVLAELKMCWKYIIFPSAVRAWNGYIIIIIMRLNVRNKFGLRTIKCESLGW
jgi:hypothetical protein